MPFQFLTPWLVVRGFFIGKPLHNFMANEIQVICGLTVRKDDFFFTTNQISKQYDFSGNRKTSATQTVTTSPETLEIATDMTDAGWAVFTNLSPSCIIFVGSTISSTSYEFLGIEPGETCVVPLATLELAAWCDTGSGQLDFTICER